VSDTSGKSNHIWLVYTALVLSGVLLLGSAFHIHFLTRLTMRLGVGLIFSALALLVGKDRPAGIIATAIIWIAIIIAIFN